MSTRSVARRTQAVAAHLMSRTATLATHAPGSQAVTPSDEELVLFESDSVLRKYVLNREKKLNSLNQPILDLLRPRIEQWSQSELCEIIVGTGKGRAFCAGGDVADVVKNAANPATRANAVKFFKSEFELDYILAAAPKPYVAVMDGITMGGGVGLSVNAAFRIATEKTVFAMPETKIGYSPDVGGSYFLSRMDGQIGTYLGLTGETVKGRAVYELGLATHYVPSRRIPELLSRLAALEGLSYSAIDALIEEHSAEFTAEESKNTLVGDVRAALDLAFKKSNVEDIVAELEKLAVDGNKADVQAWANSTLEALRLRSPTSLKVALFAIRKGKSMQLKECLDMELGIATAFCSGASPDFRTGVTAVLIDKVQSRPEWSPDSLHEIREEEIVSKFFSQASPFLAAKPDLTVPDYLHNVQPLNPMRYALPNEDEIGELVRGSHGTSSSFAITLPELIQKLEFARKGKQGVREKVAEVVARRCRKEPDSAGQEWLVWDY